MFLLGASIVQGGPVTTVFGPVTAGPGGVQFYTDYDLWAAAVGAANIRNLDFETLPDGSPAYTGALITPEFNYSDQGVTFGSPHPSLKITGSSGGLGLDATSYPDITERNWLEIAFSPEVNGVGLSNVSAYLSIYDDNNSLLGMADGGEPPSYFLGVISSDPIAWAKVDAEGFSAAIGDVHFAPVPEPASVSILIFGLCMLVSKASFRRMV